MSKRKRIEQLENIIIAQDLEIKYLKSQINQDQKEKDKQTTIAEIKEYIDNSIQESEQVGMSGYDSVLYLKNNMRTVKSMLDELEENKDIEARERKE